MNHLPPVIREICSDITTVPVEVRESFARLCEQVDTEEKHNALVEKKKAESQAWLVKSRRQGSPGTEFKLLVDSLGVSIPGCEGCQGTMARMDYSGIDGCRERREEFISEIKERAKSIGWLDYAHVAVNAVKSGLAFSINPLDPIGSLYDEAVRRAEENK